ncbi:recombination-associated protein RdgC [Xanthomonas perforans]|uniref:recombination-associated protein RdgC n=1 Tax=Xanthomonas perforans TaxID=442694 RepID=UPI0023599649|nr:recombination-associated protein RdgC [Xanthomonas perforans]MDC9654374.1 recombination-associated protein RdgC [Xanthomonas perforans]
MLFRNLTLFRFPPTLDLSQVDELLPTAILKDVGPLDMSSRGFIAPFGDAESEALLHRQGQFLWLTVGGQDRMLPPTVVNDSLAKKVAEYTQKEGRRPGGKTRKAMKEELVHDLLPKAFVKSSRIDVILDQQHGVAFVNTSSRKKAEDAMSQIRGMLGSFPALPLNAELAPRTVLTGWIGSTPMPDSLSIGEEAELRDPIEGGAVVKCQHQELQGDEIDNHLQAGKVVVKLAVVAHGTVSLVLGDDLVMRKVKFLDGATDALDSADGEGARAEFDAIFALQSAELQRLFLVLESSFKLSNAEA